MMSLKLCAIAATVYGLRTINQTPRSIKPRLSGHIRKSVATDLDNLNSYSILANYNKALIGSNLK